MKRFILTILILCSSISYGSEWVEVAASKKSTYLVDTQSIQKNGNSVTFWYRINYKTRDKYGELSVKVNGTINCKTKESQDNYAIYYDDLDNNGNITQSLSPKKYWTPIPPDTVFEGVMKFVCI